MMLFAHYLKSVYLLYIHTYSGMRSMIRSTIGCVVHLDLILFSFLLGYTCVIVTSMEDRGITVHGMYGGFTISGNAHPLTEFKL